MGWCEPLLLSRALRERQRGHPRLPGVDRHDHGDREPGCTTPRGRPAEGEQAEAVDGDQEHDAELDLVKWDGWRNARSVTLTRVNGKIISDGTTAEQAYQAGDIEGIRNYCETDVLNTFLVYLRFELIRGRLTPTEYETECSRVREYLEKEGKPHFSEFLGNWK